MKAISGYAAEWSNSGFLYSTEKAHRNILKSLTIEDEFRTLTPLIKVRALVPQPLKSLRKTEFAQQRKEYDFCTFLYIFKTCFSVHFSVHFYPHRQISSRISRRFLFLSILRHCLLDHELRGQEDIGRRDQRSYPPRLLFGIFCFVLLIPAETTPETVYGADSPYKKYTARHCSN